MASERQKLHAQSQPPFETPSSDSRPARVPVKFSSLIKLVAVTPNHMEKHPKVDRSSSKTHTVSFASCKADSVGLSL